MNPETQDQIVEMTPSEMLDYRRAAIDAAARTHAGSSVPEVLHAAGCYLNFVLTGEPIWTIGQTIRETKGEPPIAPSATQPSAPPVAEPAASATTAKTAIAKAKAAAKAVQSAPPASTAPAASPAVAMVAPATASSDTIPPPVTIKQVADELVLLVQDNSRGGFDAAKALLTSYGVTQLAQVPGNKLAQFMVDVKATGRGPVKADPTGGLLG